MEKIQKEHKDRLFKAIFGRDTKESKKWRLELYNALNGTDYTDPDALELNTIENALYITMHNDVSFLVDGQMTLFEEQSTKNNNMPLRGLFYFAKLYQDYITKNGVNINRSKRIKIPTPQYVVFYTGQDNEEEKSMMKLSDSFITPDDSGNFEWTSTIVNINENKNLSLQKKCKPLYDYISFIARIKSNQKSGLDIKTAVESAVDWAIKNGLLEGLIKHQKAEVLGMILEEFDEESFVRNTREEGYEEKAIEDAVMLVKDFQIEPEAAAEKIGAPLDKVLEVLQLQKTISISAEA